MKLIYHKIDDNEQYSPFDTELVSLAKGQEIMLVSPYIGLRYLKRLIKISKSWRLISDFQEWIISYPNKSQRFEICDFITEHFNKVRHFTDIHAKVLITDKYGFLGSANFTDKGILERTEMSVSFSQREKVEELKNWFQSLWTNSVNFTEKQLFDFVEKNENIILQPKIVKFKNPFPMQKRKLSFAPIDNFLKTDKDYELELIKAIEKTRKSNQWLNRYFDLIKELFIEFNIYEDSPKITMSITNGLKMPVSIGQRYVIRPKDKGDTIGLIMPLEFQEIISDYPNATITEGFFYTDKVQQALWVQFDSNIIFSDDNLLFESWKKAVKHEVDRTIVSGFRKSHNPFYYKIVMDLDYRKKILNDYGTGHNSRYI